MSEWTEKPKADFEEDLVAEAQAGDADAFAALLECLDSQAFGIALKITANRQDAEDVLQDSLLNAYLHLGAFRGDARFSTWLGRIAARQAVSKVRRRLSRREVSLDDPVETAVSSLLTREIEDGASDPEANLLREEQHRILCQTIDSLEPNLRVVLVMRELGTLSMKEMAGALEVSLPVAKSRLFRARQKLRERVLQRLSGIRGAFYAC